jgi:hypothetical protein
MTQHRLGQFLVAPRGSAELMLRGMDDFLFISTHRERVKEFLTVVEAGVPDYGTVFSKDKTRSNLGMLTVHSYKIHTLQYRYILYRYPYKISLKG